MGKARAQTEQYTHCHSEPAGDFLAQSHLNLTTVIEY